MKITLEHWDSEHKNELIKLCNSVNRQYLSDRIPFPYTEADADWWLDMISKEDGAGGLFRAIEVDGEYVGTVSAERKGDVYLNDAELGYMLLDNYRGRGVMSEAVRLFCPLAFDALNLTRLTALVYEPNAASCRVLEKNGFVRGGLMRKAVCKGGNIYDLVIFGKLKDEENL